MGTPLATSREWVQQQLRGSVPFSGVGKRERGAPFVPEFRGAALRAQSITEPEWLLSGPAETGKTFGGLWRLDSMIRTSPRASYTIIRKVKADIVGTVLDTYQEVIELSGSGAQPYGGESPEWYTYPNGSRLYLAGMDRPGKALSGERKGIYCNQAEELEDTDWQTLSTRTTGRGRGQGGGMLFGDCNPGPPDHWIKNRPSLTLLESVHKDNPTLYDRLGRLTEQGQRTMRALDNLTGITRLRLRDGKWVAAEGQVYDQWDDREGLGNVTEAADYIPGAGPVLWFIDDGYSGQIDPLTGSYTAQSHPRVFLLAQLRHTGQLAIFEESYAVKSLSDAHIKEVKALPYPAPDFVVVDKSAAELKGRLWAADMAVKNGANSVEESIKEAQRRIAPDDNGARMVIVHPRCYHLRREMAAYTYGKNGKPVKAFDHGPDALRYGLWATRYEV